LVVELGTLTERNILAHRGPRNPVDPWRPHLWFTEPERTAEGRIEDVAAIFLTNKECPFRCLFCDLWKNTTEERVPPGAVAGQVEFALAQSPGARHVKLYNSGNFFDDQAVSRGDRTRIRNLVSERRTVIVECHPKLVDRRCVEFAEDLAAALQVGMGLETVDPHVLPRLNKRMTLDDFARATEFLLAHEIAVRAFIMLRTPFQSEEEGVEWAQRSIDFALSIGVECCSVIPARAGNGVMERLQEQGQFDPPSLRSMETVVEYGVGLRRGRVFMDLWDIERFYMCRTCGPLRGQRLRKINLSQTVPPRVRCVCGS
jgi:radical SAM enzyme (TIGR01210 family)